MGACKDPRLTYLNDKGYNVVRLPRAGIVPLGVISRDRGVNSLMGTLDQIWRSELPVPVPGAPQAVAELKGTKTSDIKLSLGLDILANALSGMFGATAPSVNAQYSNAKSLQFSFKDVTSIGIDPFLIGNFLTKGDLASANPVVKRVFGGQKDVSALVITEVLQSKSIGVTAKKDSSTSVSVDVPAIQAILGAKVGVTATSAQNTEITYEGTQLLTFGFKAYGIGMANGEWQFYGVAPSGDTAFAIGDRLGDPIVSDGELMDIDYPMTAHA